MDATELEVVKEWININNEFNSHYKTYIDMCKKRQDLERRVIEIVKSKGLQKTKIKVGEKFIKFVNSTSYTQITQKFLLETLKTVGHLLKTTPEELVKVILGKRGVSNELSIVFK